MENYRPCFVVFKFTKRNYHFFTAFLYVFTYLYNYITQVKLFGYAYGGMTDYGRLVSFPIGSPRYRGILYGIGHLTILILTF